MSRARRRQAQGRSRSSSPARSSSISPRRPASSSRPTSPAASRCCNGRSGRWPISVDGRPERHFPLRAEKIRLDRYGKEVNRLFGVLDSACRPRIPCGSARAAALPRSPTLTQRDQSRRGRTPTVPACDAPEQAIADGRRRSAPMEIGGKLNRRPRDDRRGKRRPLRPDGRDRAPLRRRFMQELIAASSITLAGMTISSARHIRRAGGQRRYAWAIGSRYGRSGRPALLVVGTGRDDVIRPRRARRAIARRRAAPAPRDRRNPAAPRDHRDGSGSPPGCRRGALEKIVPALLHFTEPITSSSRAGSADRSPARRDRRHCRGDSSSPSYPLRPRRHGSRLLFSVDRRRALKDHRHRRGRTAESRHQLVHSSASSTLPHMRGWRSRRGTASRAVRTIRPIVLDFHPTRRRDGQGADPMLIQRLGDDRQHSRCAAAPGCPSRRDRRRRH